MWSICLADDSYEMSSLIFFCKKKKKNSLIFTKNTKKIYDNNNNKKKLEMLSGAVLIDTLRSYIFLTQNFDIFLIYLQNIFWALFRKTWQWGCLDKYPRQMFSWRNKKSVQRELFVKEVKTPDQIY